MKRIVLTFFIISIVVLSACTNQNSNTDSTNDPFEDWNPFAIVSSAGNIVSDPDLNSYKECDWVVDKAISVMLCELKSLEAKTHTPGFGNAHEYYILELLPIKQYKGELPQETITVYHERYEGNYHRTLSSINTNDKSQLENTLCIVALREVSSPYYNGKYDIIAFVPFVNGTINRAEVTENSNPEVYPKKYYIFDAHSQIFQNINQALIDTPKNGDPYIFNYYETTKVEKIVDASPNIIKVKVTDEYRYDPIFRSNIHACEVLKSLKGGPHGYKNKWVYIRFKDGDVVSGNEYIVCLSSDKYSDMKNDLLLKDASEHYQHMYNYSSTKSVFDVSQEKEIKKLIKKSTN